MGETENRLFGAPLDIVMDSQRNQYPERDLKVPFFFENAGRTILSRGTTVKGIFRIRGKIKEVKEFKERLDAGEDIEESAWLNIHVTSTLMKAFLRELPVPILLFDNYSIFMNTFGMLKLLLNRY